MNSRRAQEFLEQINAHHFIGAVQSLRHGRLVDAWAGPTVVRQDASRRFPGYDGSYLDPTERFLIAPPKRGIPFIRPAQPGLKIPVIAFGGSNVWAEALEGTISDGTQISNTVTETIVCPDFQFPGNYMQPGRIVRVWAFGVMSNVVTTPGTLTLRLRWGGVSGTAILVSAAQGLDTTARTNSLWMLVANIIVRASGTAGSFMSGGIMFGNVLSSTAANLLPALLGSAGTPLASGNAAVSVDTSVAKSLSVTGQFSVATNPTNLTCQQRIIEVMN